MCHVEGVICPEEMVKCCSYNTQETWVMPKWPVFPWEVPAEHIGRLLIMLAQRGTTGADWPT